MDNFYQIDEKVDQLLKAFISRKWQGPFSSDDIRKLIGECNQVLVRMYATGMVVPRGEEYILTRVGEARKTMLENGSSPERNRLLSERTFFTPTRGEVKAEKPLSVEYVEPRAKSYESSEGRTKFEQLRNQAREVISGTGTTLRHTPDKQFNKAYSLALVYEELLGIYKNNPALKFIGKFDDKHKNYNFFLNAAMQADALGVSYEFFVKAQFYWLDKWFNKPPKPVNLCSVNSKVPASERVRLFEIEIHNQKVDPNKNIVGKERRKNQIKVTRETKHLYSEATLRRLMKSYNASEEDILRVFAAGNHATLYFDSDWLRSNKVYLKLKELGEV